MKIPLALGVFLFSLGVGALAQDEQPVLRPLRPLNPRIEGLRPLEDVLVRPVYERECGPMLGRLGIRYYVPGKLSDGRWNPESWVTIWTERVRFYLSNWMRGLIAKRDWKAIGSLCVGIYEDVDDMGRASPNSFATSDRHLMVGMRDLAAMIRTGSNGNLDESRLVYTLAHEFGHYLQFVHQLTFNAYATNVVRELQADCISGYILTAAGGLIQNPYYKGALEMASAGGDYSFHDRDHHGTPAQRMAAVRIGSAFAHARMRSHLMQRNEFAPPPSSVELLQACGMYASDQQRANAFGR